MSSLGFHNFFFFFLTVRYVSWDFRYVSNLGGSRLNICGLDLEF